MSVCRGLLCAAVVCGLGHAVAAREVATSITKPAPEPGIPMQVWVDAAPTIPGIQRCVVDALPKDQIIAPAGIGPMLCDLAVDVRLLNPVMLNPAARLFAVSFTVHFDPSIVEAAPGFIDAPAFNGVMANPVWFVPPGAPPGQIRVELSIPSCVVGLPGGFLVFPGMNILLARLGFNALDDGQSGFDLTDIEFRTTPNSSCLPITVAAGTENFARSKVVIDHAGRNLGCFSVNRSFDAPDFSPGDGIADSNATPGIIDATLSACIAEANLRSGPDTIAFAFTPIGAPISLTAPLPPLSDPTGGTIIDGTSQPLVHLRGQGAVHGVTMTSGGHVLRGVALTGFSGAAVVITEAAQGNHVVGCRLGSDWSGAGVPNGIGVLLDAGARGNRIGGSGPGDGNLIRGSLNAGVVDLAGNLISRNSIVANGGKGIQVKSPTAVVTVLGAMVERGVVVIEGIVSGVPDHAYDIEVFGNNACAPSGFGEGQTFIDAFEVTTEASGDAFFLRAITLANGSATPWRLTMTATSSASETSEFSNCVIVLGALNPCPSDLDGNGVVNGADLALVLGSWGDASHSLPIGDINGDGVVNGLDLALVLGSWGKCP
ncbi:MAG: hypothetical protein KF724_08395 [Phycisphaeraceae bacterium]|nr:hypothetical protein [Phycisphaeraceae bacterium]